MENYKFDEMFRPGKDALLAGIDEVGRGSMAGPVVAACVILPASFKSDTITDSKRMTAYEREKASKLIKNSAVFT